ncbi:hypothetical protein [Streptomyces sp. STR69]|uniref:hypothetical protein n=1 Tax=Streptomyces sp. STR69 TaxID=1796942 RepID=UPI0021C96BAC|nr:hypothetical protein [Streptomyces sp. STR69]
MITSRDRVDVVLDVYTEDDAYRVRMVGVYQSGQPIPPVPPGATRNVVQTFLDLKTDVRAFSLGYGLRATGPIRKGSAWVWEPLKPEVRQDVRIAAVELRGGDWWVQTENIGGKKPGALHWNELDRFVEACVLVEPAVGA